jgi:hypothetical protein
VSAAMLYGLQMFAINLAFEVGGLGAQRMRFGVEGSVGAGIDVLDGESGLWCRINVVGVVPKGWIAIRVLI